MSSKFRRSAIVQFGMASMSSLHAAILSFSEAALHQYTRKADSGEVNA